MEITVQEEKPSIPVRVCVRCGREIPSYMKTYRSYKHNGWLCQACNNRLWRQKGYAAERSLCKKLERLGYCADRIPSSGPGKSNFPDIIATDKKRKISLALEVKSFYAKSVTIKKEQLIKAAMYLLRHHYDYETRKVGACVKFLMGERKKSPWVCKLIDVRDDMNLDDLEDITVNIEDKSDLPELTQMSLSKRARRIIKKRRERKR